MENLLLPRTPQEALRAIEDLDKFGIHLGLDRVLACLDALGNPQNAYPTVHVGGTNGKGSTSALIAEGLRQSGFKVGFYSSPPLESFGERMRIDGVPMPDAHVPELLDHVLAAAKTTPLAQGMTQFEVITCMAFYYFYKQHIDIAVIEVGMGGRLDSTNVITPLVSVVTNVGLEHADHLGATVELIAKEKAGIAKPGVPLITGAVGPALEALKAEAARIDAPLRERGRDFFVARAPDGSLRYQGRQEVPTISLALPGRFQEDNLALALAALEEISLGGKAVSPEAMRRAAASVRWPGRMEVFGQGPRVMIDGAHNPHAALALKEALETGFPRRRLHLILGILGDKDAASMVHLLEPLADRLLLTRSSSHRALDPGVLQKAAGIPLDRALTFDALSDALDTALSDAGPEDLILITGSLTLVGEARGLLRRRGFLE